MVCSDRTFIVFVIVGVFLTNELMDYWYPYYDKIKWTNHNPTAHLEQ